MSRQKNITLKEDEFKRAEKIKKSRGLTDREAYLTGLGMYVEPLKRGRPSAQDILRNKITAQMDARRLKHERSFWKSDEPEPTQLPQHYWFNTEKPTIELILAWYKITLQEWEGKSPDVKQLMIKNIQTLAPQDSDELKLKTLRDSLEEKARLLREADKNFVQKTVGPPPSEMGAEEFAVFDPVEIEDIIKRYMMTLKQWKALPAKARAVLTSIYHKERGGST